MRIWSMYPTMSNIDNRSVTAKLLMKCIVFIKHFFWGLHAKLEVSTKVLDSIPIHTITVPITNVKFSRSLFFKRSSWIVVIFVLLKVMMLGVSIVDFLWESDGTSTWYMALNCSKYVSFMKTLWINSILSHEEVRIAVKHMGKIYEHNIKSN